jgi:hypothetical protein
MHKQPVTRGSRFGRGSEEGLPNRKLAKGALKTLRRFLQLPLKSLNLFRYIF